MKKKYIVVKPSTKALLSSEYSAISQLSQQMEQKSRISQNKGLKNMEKSRLKTDWPIVET
jgi:hypothetical protein